MFALRSIIAAGALAVAGVAAAPAASAEKAAVYTGLFSDVAVQGYDTVAYFKVGEPVKGSSEFSTTYHGAEFQFSSQENLDLFLSDPEAYAPQYGGYCAWAMADGRTAKGDANIWKIVDGKLYLNFNQSIQNKWEKDIPGFIEQADVQYPIITDVGAQS